MTAKNLRYKIIQHNQKKNLTKFIEDLNFDELKNESIKAIYFPESSNFIESVLIVRKNNKPPGENFSCVKKIKAYENLRKKLSMLSAEPLLLCLFPNFSIMDGLAVSDFPVLEINGYEATNLIDEIMGKIELVHVFLCATPDLKKGIFFDVFAGDPEINGTDAPIYEIYAWDSN